MGSGVGTSAVDDEWQPRGRPARRLTAGCAAQIGQWPVLVGPARGLTAGCTCSKSASGRFWSVLLTEWATAPTLPDDDPAATSPQPTPAKSTSGRFWSVLLGILAIAGDVAGNECGGGGAANLRGRQATRAMRCEAVSPRLGGASSAHPGQAGPLSQSAGWPLLTTHSRPVERENSWENVRWTIEH